MPDQYIHVSFPESRTVLSGGNPVGLTNQDLAINAGTHTFTLSGPQDYSPAAQQLVVAGTSVVTPLFIVFTKPGSAHCPPDVAAPLTPPHEY